MIKPIRTAGAILLVLAAAAAWQLHAGMKESPANIAAALILKAAAFEKNMSSGGEITIYVMNAPDVARELRSGIGDKIGNATLSDVQAGSGLPSFKPSILFIGDAGRVGEALAYTRDRKVLSVTSMPELVERGVTLGVGIGDDGKPKLILNLTSTVAEGMDWNPALIKIAQVIK